MPYITLSDCIEVEDFLSDCSDEELDAAVEYLEDVGKIKPNSDPEISFASRRNNFPGLIEHTENQFHKLSEFAYQFTKEEEAFLETMYKKYL